MSKIPLFLAISILFATPLSVSSSLQRMKRQSDKCHDSVFIRECNIDDKETEGLMHLFRSKTNQMVAKFQTNCKFDSIQYRWTINSQTDKVVDYVTNNVFVIYPFALKKGHYGILVAVTITRNGKESGDINGCDFTMDSLDPIPLISGGSERTVEAGLKFVVDGTESINRDSPHNETGTLDFKWNCGLLEGPNKDFCQDKEYKGNKLQVPEQYSIKDYKYIFYLSVRNADSSWKIAQQIISIFEEAIELEIVCEKNCPPASAKTVTKRLTFLRVKCLKRCSHLTYEWGVESEESDFNYEEWTQFGRNSDKFVIKEGVLKPDKKYKVEVRVKGREEVAKKVLQVEESIRIEECEVKPNEGKAIETKFRAECKYTGSPFNFEVYTLKSGKMVVLEKGYRVESLEFVLPEKAEAYVRVTDVEGIHDDYKLNVKVNPPDSSRISNLTDSLKTLVTNGDTDTAIQISNGLMDKIEEEPSPESEEIKEVILETLKTVTMKSQDDARRVTFMITRLVHDPNQTSDPHRGKAATTICKRASEIDLKYFKKEYHPTNLVDDVRETTESLMMCGETDSRENFEILKPEALDFQVTTPFPVLEEPVIEEDYPDYNNDDSVGHKKRNYEIISENVVGICENNLEIMALTVVEGEDTVISSTEKCTAQITRDVGKKLVGMTIEVKGAQLLVSRDLETVGEVIDVMVCSWDDDPFWWNPSGRSISTRILLIKVVRDSKELTQFEEPYQMILDLHDIEDGVQIHEAHSSPLRIDVKRNEGFFIEFHDLSREYRVLITNFDKPDRKQVQEKGEIVTASRYLLYQEEENGYDSWYYVSVLPESKYAISVFTKSCYSWSISSKEWEFTCKTDRNSTRDKVVCNCNHLSILGGVIYNNPIRIDEITTDPDFEMVLLHSCIIFISVGTIFALYSLLLTLVVPNKPKPKIFLPGDISTSSRYVYLLAIRTGKKPSSGTTSTICIKLFGDRNESRSHVLNYPDPQGKLLQRTNTDWFIIPTVQHLGNLTEIDLWSDYGGRNPSWFCTNVTVFDLQTNQKWYFDINSWFELPPGRIFHKVGISDERRGKKRKLEMLWRVFPKRTHQEEFSRFMKLNLVLSIFLMIFSSCLIIIGVPRLVLRDGFATIEEYEFESGLIWMGLSSSVLTFIPHMVLEWLLRNSGDGRKFAIRVFTYCCFLLGFNIVVSMAVMIIFGFWVPPIDGYLWLTSVIISTLFYFFILENIYELVTSFWRVETTAVVDPNWKKLLRPIEKSRSRLFKEFGENLLRPYFTDLYQPLGEDDVKERKLHEESKKKLYALLEDTVMFFCYVTLLYLVIFANRNSMTIINHQEMIQLLSGHHTRTPSYEDVNSINDIYEYLNSTLIPTLHSLQWYGAFVVKEPGLMIDFHNKFLGVVRLRQKRAIRNPCLVDKNDSCRSEFWYSEQSYERFGVGNELERLLSAWDYTPARIAGQSVYVGKFGFYSGGGYIAPLGRTWYNSYANLMYLINQTWIDSSTSAVMIEFLAYNVNTNLFNAVRIFFEISSTGYLRIRLDLSTAQFLFVKGEEQTVRLVIIGAFLLVLSIFTLKFLSRIFKSRFLVFKDLWTLIDLLIVGLSYGCFALFLHRAQSVKDFLDEIEKMKKNEFIDYFNLLHEDITFTLVAAFLIFIATIRLWKVCRFGDVFKIMEKTVGLSFGPILVVLLCHIIIIFAFTLCGYFTFGSSSNDFKDVRDTLITLMLLMMGMQNIDFQTVPGQIYYIAYNILNQVFLTIYVAVIMIYYYQAQIDVSGENDFSNVRQFFLNELIFCKTFFKMGLARLRGGTLKRRHFVSPKEDDLHYEGCITLPSNSLEFMCCVVIRDLKRPLASEEKIKLMHRVVRCSIKNQSIDIFFSERYERYVKIIHENRLKRVALAVESILSYDGKKRDRAEKKYRRVMNRQLRKLNFIKQVLDAILRVVSNIEIE